MDDFNVGLRQTLTHREYTRNFARRKTTFHQLEHIFVELGVVRKSVACNQCPVNRIRSV